MPPPSLEVANAALRLDPELLPPIGAMVLVRSGTIALPVRSGWVVSYGVRREIRKTNWSWVNRLVVVATVYKDSVTSPQFDFWPEELSEIVSLPPDCPPIGEWNRVSDVLREKDPAF